MADIPDRHERLQVLSDLEQWLERPLQILGFVWLGLLVIELTQGIGPVLVALSTAIWVVFILDFALRLWLAPDRSDYLRRNWFSIISLAVPALRVFRIFRAARVLRAGSAARGVRLVRVVGSVNRGMRALGRTMGRRGLGYVLGLTLLVTLGGAAGMYTFEASLADGDGLDGFGAALWWTAMIMTTLGSEYWPRTAEGRILCVLLAAYAFAVFGYLTASLASFFIGRDAEREDAELAGQAGMNRLQEEIAGLRAELRAVMGGPGNPGRGGG